MRPILNGRGQPNTNHRQYWVDLADPIILIQFNYSTFKPVKQVNQQLFQSIHYDTIITIPHLPLPFIYNPKNESLCYQYQKAAVQDYYR